MFREKPSAYDRMTDAIGNLGERLSDLEAQIVERIHPRPSKAERLRRAVEREMNRLYSSADPSYSRYLPSFLTGWSLPSAEDARSGLHHARRSLSDGAHEVGDQVSGLSRYLPSTSSILPSWGHQASFRSGRGYQRSKDYLRDNPNVSTALIAGGAILAIGGAIYITKKIADHAEEPDFDTVRKDGDIEIRDYDALVVAETIKTGYHEKARRRGFESLYDYIASNNRSARRSR